MEQAKRAATALQEYNTGAVAVYSSPMLRALQTARPICARLQLPLHVFPDLCESGGLREARGMCREEILQDFPDATLAENITATGWWTPNPDEEAVESVFHRATQSLTLLRERHDAGDGVIVVTHGTFGHVLLSLMLGLDAGSGARFPLNNCGLSRLDLASRLAHPGEHPTTPDTVTEYAFLQFHNVTAHLPPDLLT
jgi:broad specificity phosphatase PhoE